MEYQVYVGRIPIGATVGLEQANAIRQNALQYVDNVRIEPVTKPNLTIVDGGKK